LQAVARANQEASAASDKASEAKAKENAAYSEAALAIQQQTGQVSRYDAAVQLANIHAQQYADQMKGLQAELTRQQGIDPNSAGSINAQAAIAKANADRQVQVMQDAANTAADTWRGALTNANGEWVQNSQDSAAQVTAIYRQAVDGFNNDVVNKAVTGKGNFAGTFRGLGESVAKTGLQRIEAPIFGALGGGKPDGSRSNPINVNVVNALGSLGNTGSSGAINDLMKTASPSIGGTAGQGGGIGGFFSSLFGITAGIAGHLAIGGSVKAGNTYEVGEAGAELFTAPSDGTITPHNAIGGNTYYAINVANGVTPEETDMRVQAALKAYHPHGVKAAVHAVHDQQRRSATR